MAGVTYQIVSIAAEESDDRGANPAKTRPQFHLKKRVLDSSPFAALSLLALTAGLCYIPDKGNLFERQTGCRTEPLEGGDLQ
jgi:hypothetical protein